MGVLSLHREYSQLILIPTNRAKDQEKKKKEKQDKIGLGISNPEAEQLNAPYFTRVNHHF